MRKGFCFSAALLTALIFSFAAFAQSLTITGKITNSLTKEGVSAVSVTVKGTGEGTFTDPDGAFKLSVKKFPVTLIISSVGFDQQEVIVNSASETVNVSLNPASSLGQEVVISATRTPQRILESPVSIERIGVATIRNAPVPDYYDLVKNLKGVDLTTSSINFKTPSTRGFNGSGNLRFNQLVDGMDNQAPGLNFSVGSIVGPTELDVDNVELLQGASSALYGSGGTNGTLLITSKDPFKYQGLSFQIKQGVNRIGGGYSTPAPYYDWAFRWGKVVSRKFAFKVSAQMISALDWEAKDMRDLSRTSAFPTLKGNGSGTRSNDPNYDGLNVYGDEVSTSMQALAIAARGQLIAGGGSAITNAVDNFLGLGLSYSQIVAQFNANPGLAPYAQFLPFLVPTSSVATNPYRTTYTGASGGSLVSRTGYSEKDVVDYHAYDVRLTGGVNYKITDKVEASLLANYGTGTSVYTGADRYSLKNLKMGQYKAEIKGSNWFLRGYTTQERSGDSYAATLTSIYINNSWKSNSTWFQQYAGTYGTYRMQLGANDSIAHAAARGVAETGRLLPGTQAYNDALQNAKSTSISKGGGKFEDATNLYQFEGQYDFKDIIKPFDLLVGASYRVYHLNSHGTIFADTTGPINISEAGMYAQIQKNLLNDVLKLTGSLRYDKNENFNGRVTPRATALIKVAPNNNIRVSYQTAYRFPSNQDQYINLITPSARLIGGLPEFNTYFNFPTNPVYTSESIVAYQNSVAGGAPNPTLLHQAQFQTIKPETTHSYELGYRGLITSKFLVDAYVYYSQYKDFIGRTSVGRGVSGNPVNAPVDLASPFTTNFYSFVVNTTNDVQAIGWGVSGSYQLAKGYALSANFSGDQLHNVPANFITQFNTPKFRYNLGFSNSNLKNGLGFDVRYRWQDKINWEGTFATGVVPSFETLDLQFSYKPKNSKSVLKIGGSNFLNRYHETAFGNPKVGGIYYVSFGYNL
jgi:outer membrane receptor protein involved in Fe transport